MTDTSLPSQPSSVSAVPSVDPASYVDSYAPPSMSAAPSVPASVSPVADTPAVPPAQAPAPTSPSAASDPLTELEKALEEYEARQKQLASQAAPPTPTPSMPAEPSAPVASSPATSVDPVSPTAPAVASSTTPDPLAELEKALNEYESRQKALADQKQEVVQEAQQVAQQADGEDPLAELERVLDEYESKYKQETDASEPVSTPAPNTAGLADQPSEDVPLTQPQLNSVLKDELVQSAPPASISAPASNEAIEEQNIFELLGVTNAQAAEKEAFLDELQEALWDDFLDKDLALLVTPEQLKEVKDLRAQAQLPENERQEKLIAKVESLVPDIEEIMLEKALELKEDMVRERISGLKEYYAQKPDELAKVHEAEQLAAAGRWKSVAILLNSLTA